ncbi:hypothetical protein [Kosakonia sp. 1610]|uniref:hypothetical protein n=1 Tax=Kosakonia sp. 1610 TaxID=3156426 RepID=UPI003D2043C6
MISFVAFYLMWAERMGWKVPDCHIVACNWMQHRGKLAVLRCFRGFSKSTILAIYNAWRFYTDRQYRILHQSESDTTALKTSRDTQNILRNHPLTQGLLPPGNGTVEQWWVEGANDRRNASMFARGSQYQLHSKPIGDVRLDPDRIREYNVEPELRYANRAFSMWLGSVQIVGAVAWWDVATGKVKADASAFSLMLTDSRGHLYWHVCQDLKGDLATFDDNDKIIGGQVMQIKELVIKYQIPKVCVEVNGPGSFAGKLLLQALKGTGCGVKEEYSVTNKQKRILDAFEAPLTSGFLWAHSDVLDGPMYGQMRDFNPELTNQHDDFIDSGAGAISQTPVRIGKLVGNPTGEGRENWRPIDGDHHVETDY